MQHGIFRLAAPGFPIQINLFGGDVPSAVLGGTGRIIRLKQLILPIACLRDLLGLAGRSAGVEPIPCITEFALMGLRFKPAACRTQAETRRFVP